MQELIFYTDPKIVDGSFYELSNEERIRHHIGIRLGIRNSVGGICMRASDAEIDAHAQRCPEDYASLHQSVFDNLMAQGYIQVEEFNLQALAA